MGQSTYLEFESKDNILERGIVEWPKVTREREC